MGLVRYLHKHNDRYGWYDEDKFDFVDDAPVRKSKMPVEPPEPKKKSRKARKKSVKW